MADKKKRKRIIKKRNKVSQQKKKKRALRLVKSQPKLEPQVIERPGMPHMGAPDGFRSISFSQAMMEYAKPLMERMENEDDLNKALQASGLFWNYALSVERGEADKRLEKKIIRAVKSTFGMDKQEADALLRQMIERHGYLFPQDIQPEPGLPFMFIRKEMLHIIRPFDYNSLKPSDKIIPPDKNDAAIITRLKELDRHIYENAGYEAYEELLFSLKDEVEDKFEKWLIAKGLKGDVTDFSTCLHIYFDFVYGYMHDEVFVFKSVPHERFLEFFEDYQKKKMM
ncbi:MAG: hypothetical protein JRG69_09325, partial [Deltaproteobacteria bacterium]|nr:hypothetical protein [Deltaproteobacteria bacterium]